MQRLRRFTMYLMPFSACANDQEVFDTIKGKTLYVVDMKPVKAARYNRDGQITGTRDRNIPVFSFKKPE